MKIIWLFFLFFSFFSLNVNAFDLMRCKQVQQPNKGLDSFEEICNNVSLDPKETAVIVVDVWDTLDNPGSKPYLIKLNKKLQELRKLGVLILHGAGGAGTHDQKYLQMNNSIKKSLGEDYCENSFKTPLRMEMELFRYPLKKLCSPLLLDSNKFSKYVVPELNNKNEFIVNFEDEVLYLLFTHNTKNLLYFGVALDHCILNQEYGLMKFATNHAKDSAMQIYLFSNMLGVLNASAKIASIDLQKNIFLNSLSIIPNVYYTKPLN